MVHDKLWLENSLGFREASGLSWPEAPRAQAAARRESPAHGRPRGQTGAPDQAAEARPRGPIQSVPPDMVEFPGSQGPAVVRIDRCEPEPGPFLDAGSGLSKQERLEALRSIARDCTRCDLCRNRKTVVFGEGAPDADLMFIGEGPGYHEDRSGRPFVGKAGQLLDRIINAIDMKREEVYIANIVKCHPPRDRTPNPGEAQTCVPYLLAQIRIIQPKAVCLLGATAARYMTGSHGGITRLRGHWLEHRGIPMMPTYHPAYLLRNESEKRACWQDMQKVRDKVRELSGEGG